MRLTAQLFLQRPRQPRLADARLSRQQHHAALAALGLVPAAQQQLKFLFPPEKWRRSRLMLRLEPAFNLAYPEHLTHMHWLGKSLERVPPEIAVVEERTDQAVGDGRDDDRIGLSDRLQARHQVRGLADRGVLLGNALTNEVANDNHTRADGYASLHDRICCGFEGCHGLEYCEARQDC